MIGVVKVVFPSGTQAAFPVSSIAYIGFNGQDLDIIDIRGVTFKVIDNTATQADYDALVGQIENAPVKITTC